MDLEITDATPVWGQLERHWLDDTSWVDIGRGWLSSEQSDEAMDALRDGVAWKQNTVWRYDHAAPEPRLSAMTRPGPTAVHPNVTAMHRQLRRTYQVALDGVSLCWYRTGRDAMGVHRDSDMRFCEETVIAIVTLGATRPWTVQARSSGRPDFDVAPAHGDLLVMGGRAQADWLHGVPPAPGVREGRMSLQWRWTSRRGRPETGGASGAPRAFGSGR